MVWSLLAAIPLLALLSLWLLRFHYRIRYESPSELRAEAGVRFLWWRKTLSVEPLRALGLGAGEKPPSPAASATASGPGPGPYVPDGQRGALRLPDSWASALAAGRERFRRAGLKWLLDPGVWRLLVVFGWGSGRRALWLIRPRLESLHLGLENAYDLARLASAWSAAQATVPALACSTTYGFGAPTAEIRLGLGGRFTALGLASLGLVSLTTFPFRGLTRRFAHCWRHPELARWQKRVLLP